jgi:hypothetical protein
MLAWLHLGRLKPDDSFINSKRMAGKDEMRREK